jgi:hypothetical protein
MLLALTIARFPSGSLQLLTLLHTGVTMECANMLNPDGIVIPLDIPVRSTVIAVVFLVLTTAPLLAGAVMFLRFMRAYGIELRVFEQPTIDKMLSGRASHHAALKAAKDKLATMKAERAASATESSALAVPLLETSNAWVPKPKRAFQDVDDPDMPPPTTYAECCVWIEARDAKRRARLANCTGVAVEYETVSDPPTCEPASSPSSMISSSNSIHHDPLPFADSHETDPDTLLDAAIEAAKAELKALRKDMQYPTPFVPIPSVLLSIGYWTPRSHRASLGYFFSALLPEKLPLLWYLLPFVRTYLLVACVHLSIVPCLARIILAVCMPFLVFVAVVLVRPYRVPLRNATAAFAALTSGVLLLVAVVPGVDTSDRMTALTGLMLLSSASSVVISVASTALAFVENKFRRAYERVSPCPYKLEQLKRRNQREAPAQRKRRVDRARRRGGDEAARILRALQLGNREEAARLAASCGYLVLPDGNVRKWTSTIEGTATDGSHEHPKTKPSRGARASKRSSSQASHADGARSALSRTQLDFAFASETPPPERGALDFASSSQPLRNPLTRNHGPRNPTWRSNVDAWMGDDGVINPMLVSALKLPKPPMPPSPSFQSRSRGK